MMNQDIIFELKKAVMDFDKKDSRDIKGLLFDCAVEIKKLRAEINMIPHPQDQSTTITYTGNDVKPPWDVTCAST